MDNQPAGVDLFKKTLNTKTQRLSFLDDTYLDMSRIAALLGETPEYLREFLSTSSVKYDYQIVNRKHVYTLATVSQIMKAVVLRPYKNKQHSSTGTSQTMNELKIREQLLKNLRLEQEIARDAETLVHIDEAHSQMERKLVTIKNAMMQLGGKATNRIGLSKEHQKVLQDLIVEALNHAISEAQGDDEPS